MRTSRNKEKKKKSKLEKDNINAMLRTALIRACYNLHIKFVQVDVSMRSLYFRLPEQKRLINRCFGYSCSHSFKRYLKNQQELKSNVECII